MKLSEYGQTMPNFVILPFGYFLILLKELIPLAQLENSQTLKLQSWAASGRIRLASSKRISIN